MNRAYFLVFRKFFQFDVFISAPTSSSYLTPKLYIGHVNVL